MKTIEINGVKVNVTKKEINNYTVKTDGNIMNSEIYYEYRLNGYLFENRNGLHITKNGEYIEDIGYAFTKKEFVGKVYEYLTK